LQVKVKRAGLSVRYRSGFFGTSDRDAAPVPRTRNAQIAHALASPFGTGALGLRLTTLFSHADKTGAFINSLLYFDPKQLQFTDEPDDWHKAVIDIVAMTFGDAGQSVDTIDKTWTIRVKGDVYRNALKQGMVYSVHVPIKKPGAYQMRVVLRDSTSEQVGSASQFIEVPDIDKGRLALSGIVLRAEVAEPKAPASPEHPEGQQAAESDPLGTPAVRIFKPGAALLYGYQILNAQEDGAKKPDLEVQTRLFRDGQEIYSGKPAPVTVNGQADTKNLIAGGRMQLGGKMPAGDYVLQVVVTDKLAKEKYRLATQSMDFEIRPSQDAAK
jgi:hypothetical protein